MSRPISNDDLERVHAEFAAGKPIAAMKLYRAATGAGLVEAKQFVETLGSNPQATAPGGVAPSDANVDAIQAALFAGKKIEAIKLHRAATGLGLKESKEFIEALDAELRRREPQRFTAPGAKGCGTVVLALVVAVGVLAGVACAIR